ncbi:MAG TPA: glycoside hydrolase family 3 N-terminal domain-containing protein, partial [Vicinamibacteria bacterium]|nr:glycoside hydrolase family 3 N-terminal domain-containing protein [Vicinamibacteria bacterium]
DRGALRSEGDIRGYFLGSVLSGGGSSPPDATAPGWAEMYDRYQAIALQTRLRIPIVYGIDAVHGHNNVRGAVIFPHNVGLGCTRDAGLVERVARATAEEVAATGIDWTFSPCIAVARDERWGRTYESFGETPELAVEMGAAAVRGYQPGVLACAKHFVADGGTEGGRDQGDARIDEGTLRAMHLPAYRSAVAAGAATVMASFSSWNGQKMHGHRYLLTDVLKGELGFGGFVVSDWGGVDQLPGDYASQVETAISAGIDMVMVPGRYPEFVSTLKALVQSGRVPQSRVDDAVRRILRRKVDAGLFATPYADRALLAQVGSDAHRQVAREAVRRSLVLLENDGRVLPLSKTARRVHVAGRNADDLGNQCGGWTITWQGSSGAITTGTTILQAIRAAVGGGTEVTYSRDGSGAAGAEAGVVVIGETPYAEGQGDRTDLSLAAEDVAAVRAVEAAGVPTVVVLVSGRPLILGDVLRMADAIVAAWLPGTEGAGVADVLFGDHAPTGRLNHSWPRSMSQVPLNVGDDGYDPLFAYGHGLTY